jgi:hypothetical protein
MAIAQRNSFVTIAEQVQLLNNNTVSILTSMNKIVTSEDSAVTVTQLDNEGNESTYSLPTVGKLQADINTLNNNVKRLSGLNDNTVHIIEGNSTKKIYLADLSREPNRIDKLNTINTFTSTNNWFFESLMNPSLSINFDLTDKIGNDVDGVLSRRYILDFEKDSDMNYTDKGNQARNDFFDKFVNKTDININDFLDWLTNSTNTGVVNNTTPKYDEQYFEFSYQEVKEHGIFSVMKQEVDTINNKLWYHIYPFKYTTTGGTEKVLQKGDEIILNKQDSVSRWQILETSVASSDFRIRVERIEGYDPIPTGANILKYYGGKSVNNIVQVTVGFDEYLVVFVKPTNSRNKIKGSAWSKGTGLYTNDLVLDTDSNISMAQYYLDTVYDYGTLLKDMIIKNIPSKYGLTPNAPVLTDTNFKVVQINKHLTDTSDSRSIKDLHSQKNSTKTKIEQVNSAIIQKNKELSVKKYSSVAEKNKSQNELTKLVQEQESLSKLMSSLTTQIKSKTDTVNTADAKFRVRGFWTMPEPVQEQGYREQEVVQFIIQYRYSSKTGTENQTEGYTVTDGNTTQTGYFSNWVQLLSDLRKRTYNEETEEWIWEIEDVSDADTPNINQLDIPIQAQEKVEIRIKSISEVGYPDSQINSDWSNVLTITFPDDLNNVLGENEFILQEAQSDSQTIEFEQTLSTKGITQHVSESFTYNEEYYAHTDASIQTVYKDDQGNPFNLREYLQYLTNKITSLEEIIYSAKGILKVSIFNGSDEVEIKNNSSISIDIKCQNYGNTLDSVNYDNKLYIIKDYYLKIENLASSSTLNFLVTDLYVSGTTIRLTSNNLACLVDKDNDLVVQEPNQYIYFVDNADGLNLYSGTTPFDPGTVTPNSYLRNNLYSVNKIAGLSNSYINKGRSGNTAGIAYSALGENDSYGYNDWDSGNTFGTLICPQVNSINDLIVDASTTKNITNKEILTIPLNIYWKFIMDATNSINITNLTYVEHTKSIRVRLHPSSITGAFDFKVTFNLKNKNI